MTRTSVVYGITFQDEWFWKAVSQQDCDIGSGVRKEPRMTPRFCTGTAKRMALLFFSKTMGSAVGKASVGKKMRSLGKVWDTE